MGSIATAAPAQFLIIGAGSRGQAYARAVRSSTTGVVAAVAEIEPSKRDRFGKKYIWGEDHPLDGQSFSDWTEFVEWETERRKNVQATSDTGHGRINITGVFICTLDETHADIIRALAPLNLHIMCEKPLALSLKDCLSISQSLSQYPAKIVSIGHVLRYSPHNMTLRKLLVTDQVIGEIVSIEHTEPVGWWHFSHSYVRGNWRRSQEQGVGSLLTKSCHDIDFLLWLLCSPSELTGDRAHLPSSISSHGALTHFRKARKPKLAGTATNCLSCAAEPTCIYSAKQIYVERKLKQEKEVGWPVKIVMPEIEDVVRVSGWEGAETKLLEKLGEDYDQTTVPDGEIAKQSWYGRCVYEADNDVMDDQTVVISWEEDQNTTNPNTNTNTNTNTNNNNDTTGRGPKQAIFHMTYPTQAQCERRGRIYGTQGEITYDSRTITIHTFTNSPGSTSTRVVEIPKQAAEVEKSHGGGDWGLTAAFVKAVQAVNNKEMSVNDAQMRFVGCDLREIVRSHAVVFAAEEARIEKRVVGWSEWCARNGLL